MGHTQRLWAANWSLWLLSLVMLLFVLVNNEKSAVNIFRVGICLPVLVLACKQIIAVLSKDEFARLLSVFLLWGLLSLLWSPADNISLFDNLVARTLTIIAVFYMVYHASKHECSRLILEYVYLASALVLLANSVISRDSPNHGFGSFDSLNLVAWFISSAAVMSFEKIFLKSTVIVKVFFFCLTIFYFLALLQMGSRAAFLGLITGGAAVCIYHFIYSDLKWHIAGFVSFIIFVFFVMMAIDNSYVLWLIERGDSSRFAVYKSALGLIIQTPASVFFGHGLAADTVNFTEYKRVAHFHSIYLSTLFYTGLVGLFFFLAFALRRPWLVFIKKHPACSWDFVLIGGLVTFIFTGDKFISYPGGFFYAFLLPLFFANTFGSKGRYIKK